MPRLASNSYGKSRVRLVKVSPDRRTVREITVSIALEGDFEAAHVAGDNAHVLPTDTMKNTVYALGKDHRLDSLEAFAAHLARHFLGRPHVTRVTVEIVSPAWRPLGMGGTPRPDAFRRDDGDVATCRVTADADGARAAGGLRDLVILKTARSGFAGYPRDEFTTLGETDDRLLGTALTAEWTYASPDVDFARARDAAKTALLTAFADHDSLSVQQTLYAMAEAVLAASDALTRVRLSMPNKHCLLVDLSTFGLDNDNEIFLPIDEPYGLIEATVER